MFGEYAQIATYLPSSQDASGSGDSAACLLPPHLYPPTSAALPPWGGGGGGTGRKGRGQEPVESKQTMEDFVMVAEFSEIEGPKPVLTIPKDAGSSIDQNALSVKLMAVDHQTSSEGFSISEDTQVVLSDHESGVTAFVHHFVLYDNQARGFVRPYCMVFISTDVRKIMTFYEELSSQFKRVARFLKYGNKMLFVKDLERHLQDLEHTKGYLLNQVSRTRLKESPGDGSDKSRNVAENELYKGLQNIRQSTTEIRDILSILKPLLHDRRLESRFRVLEERAFQCGNDNDARTENLSLQENWFADNLYSESSVNGAVCGSFNERIMSPVSLFTSGSSHTPVLVETKKAKRFNSPLRGLHQLCSWGAKEGLRKLRSIHEYFKRDSMVLEIERNETRLMDPSNSMILHGHCITSNVLSGVAMRGASLCLSEDSSSMLLASERLVRWPSIASDDTLESFQSVESYMSLQDADESASLYSFASNNSSTGLTTSASAQDFISAPTSPMTEEAPFPISPRPPLAASPEGLAGSSATAPLGAVSVARQPETLQPADAQTAEGPPQLISADSRVPVSSGDSLRETGSSAQSFDSESDPCPDSSCGGSLMGERTESSSHTSTCTASCQSGNENHASCSNAAQNLGRTERRSESQTSDPNLDVASQTVQNGEKSELEGSSTSLLTDLSTDASASPKEDEVSKIADIFFQHTSVKNGVKSLPDEDTSKSKSASDLSRSVSLNSGVEFSCSLNSDLSEGSSVGMAVSRVPSFVPLMGRAVHTKQPMSSLSSSPSKSVDSSPRNADRSKLDFTESFKSCTDSIGQTEDGCCDGEGIPTVGAGNATTPSSDCCSWRPRNGVYTLGDVLNSLGPGRPGYGIHEVLSSYTNLQSVVFSLMTGRTVLVVGPAKMEAEVSKMVTALSIFLSDAKRRQHSVIVWMNRPLKVTDLTRILLAGICRSEKRSLDATVPTAVKQYSTVMDVERRMIIGPVYQGTLLQSVLQQKKSFKTDAQHVAFIHSWLMEISNKAFIFYHSFCLGDAGGLTHHSVENHREQYKATVCSLMNRLGVRDHDVTIVEHLAEKIKLSQLEPHIWNGVDKASVVHPLIISSRGSHTVRC